MSFWSKIGLADQQLVNDLMTELRGLREENQRLTEEKYTLLLQQMQAQGTQTNDILEAVTDINAAECQRHQELNSQLERQDEQIHGAISELSGVIGAQHEKLVGRTEQLRAEQEAVLQAVNSLDAAEYQRHQELNGQLEGQKEQIHGAISELSGTVGVEHKKLAMQIEQLKSHQAEQADSAWKQHQEMIQLLNACQNQGAAQHNELKSQLEAAEQNHHELRTYLGQMQSEQANTLETRKEHQIQLLQELESIQNVAREQHNATLQLLSKCREESVCNHRQVSGQIEEICQMQREFRIAIDDHAETISKMLTEVEQTADTRTVHFFSKLDEIYTGICAENRTSAEHTLTTLSNAIGEIKNAAVESSNLQESKLDQLSDQMLSLIQNQVQAVSQLKQLYQSSEQFPEIQKSIHGLWEIMKVVWVDSLLDDLDKER